MPRLRVLSVAVAVTVAATALTAAGGAIAQPRAGGGSAQAGDELKRKAQELLSEGNQLAAQGDFLTALIKFRAAYELYASPKLLINIGTSLRQIGRFAEAAATYEQYLADPEADPRHGDEVRSALEEVSKLVGFLELEPSEPDARVSVDGRVLEAEEQHGPVRVDPGYHTVVAEKPGRTSTVRQVQVASGATVEVELPLAAPGEAPPEPIPVRPIVGYGLAGLGGAAIITAIILGVVAGTTDAEADEHCASGGEFVGYCNQEGADLKSSARDLSTAGLVVGLGGLAVGVGGLALVWTTPEEPEPATTGPVTGRLGIGLQLGGRW